MQRILTFKTGTTEIFTWEMTETSQTVMIRALAPDRKALQQVIDWASVISEGDVCEMSAQNTKDTKGQHPPQPQSVYPAAIWQKIQKKAAAIPPDYRAASFRLWDSPIDPPHSTK